MIHVVTILLLLAASPGLCGSYAEIERVIDTYAESEGLVVVGRFLDTDPFDPSARERVGTLLVEDTVLGSAAAGDTLTLRWLAARWKTGEIEHVRSDGFLEPDLTAGRRTLWFLRDDDGWRPRHRSLVLDGAPDAQLAACIETLGQPEAYFTGPDLEPVSDIDPDTDLEPIRRRARVKRFLQEELERRGR